MKRTANYALPDWEKSDFIKMDDFNDMTRKLDAALKANADAAAGAASAAVVTALAQDVGAGGKNCRIAWGSYTGTGKYGSANPNTLTFDFKPLLVAIGNVDNTNAVAWPTVMIFGADSHCDGDQQRINITWKERSISWYNSSHQTYQNNYENRRYNYIVIGC